MTGRKAKPKRKFTPGNLLRNRENLERFTTPIAGYAGERVIQLAQRLASEMEPLRAANPDGFNKASATIAELVSVVQIGMMASSLPKFLSSADKAQAGTAQNANSAKSAAIKDKIRQAILEKYPSATLRNSSKFADAIRHDVCKRAGVTIDAKGKAAAKGFATRSIQRVISAILEECRSDR
jgi:hypothetical protein